MRIVRKRLQGTACRRAVEQSSSGPRSQLTYDTVGMSLPTYTDEIPEGYVVLEDAQVVGKGRDAYERVGWALMHWQINREAGFFVQPQHAAVRLNEHVAVALPLAGLFAVTATCKVVAIIAEGDRTGFAYGSLPNHPEQGEEAFWVSFDEATEDVTLTIRSVSRPASWFTKLGAPVAAGIQRKAVEHYLEAGESIASGQTPLSEVIA